jgi:hypothetical protein
MIQVGEYGIVELDGSQQELMVPRVGKMRTFMIFLMELHMIEDPVHVLVQPHLGIFLLRMREF